MRLSELIGKPVFVGDKQRGTFQGVFLSPKYKTVKYLLCNIDQKNAKTALAVSVSCVERFEECIVLKRIRSTLPKNAVLFKMGCPAYTEEGTYLGVTLDVEIYNLTATDFFTESGRFSATAVCAIGDAVLMKKEQPYPIGQRIPAHTLLQLSLPSNVTLVSKPILKNVIKAGRLVSFTLSLPPFHL